MDYEKAFLTSKNAENENEYINNGQKKMGRMKLI